MTGYTRIIQYGDIIETYEYEKIIKKKGADARKAEQLIQKLKGNNGRASSNTLDAKRKKQRRIQSKEKGNYRRSHASIIRSKKNFFRLCHHNNCLAKTIHFVTLTFSYDLTFKEANRHVKRFMERVQKSATEISLRYISVPELTKKGRYHYHLLVYDLPTQTAGIERETRNFQRQFQRGYVDISPATYTSEGIAGYMAKYMAKALTNEKIGSTRTYTCSRGINKVFSAGGNSLTGYLDVVIPSEYIVNREVKTYDVPYLGKCRLTKITKKL